MESGLQHRIWSEPLSEIELEVIRRVVNEGSHAECITWLNHVTKVAVAMAEEKENDEN